MVVSGVLDNVPWNALDNIHAALYASMESKGAITVAEALVVLTGATVPDGWVNAAVVNGRCTAARTSASLRGRPLAMQDG